VAEGLLNYLSEEEAGRLLRRMRNMSAAGSYVGADSLSHTTLSSPLMEGIRGQLQSMDAPLRFGTNAPEAFLKAAGWEEPEVASLGDPDRAHYDRWPLSPYLQYLPAFLCPKGFLMTAKATSDGLG
jgi:O-methyltransferase involved in polyketide biosynthesis